MIMHRYWTGEGLDAVQSAIAAALQAKQAELDEAIEALRPFACMAVHVDHAESEHRKDHDLLCTYGESEITLGHCRQAAAIVARHGSQPA